MQIRPPGPPRWHYRIEEFEARRLLGMLVGDAPNLRRTPGILCCFNFRRINQSGCGTRFLFFDPYEVSDMNRFWSNLPGLKDMVSCTIFVCQKCAWNQQRWGDFKIITMRTTSNMCASKNGGTRPCSFYGPIFRRLYLRHVTTIRLLQSIHLCHIFFPKPIRHRKHWEKMRFSHGTAEIGAMPWHLCWWP